MQQQIINILKKHTKLKEIKLEAPPSQDLGDFAFPCFELAKIQKKNPAELAADLAKKISPVKGKGIEKIQAIGPYLNFFLSKSEINEFVLKKILKEKDKYGSKNLGKNQKIMIEFSQPNTHKAFHIGHLRGTCLGEDIARILEFTNHKIIRANYSGDTGMHIAKWIWCYQKFHPREKPKKDESWFAKIYAEAINKLEDNEKAKEEVEEINRKLDLGEDKKITRLWKQTRNLSIASWKEIYKDLNTHFDIHYLESQVEKRGKEISKQLLSKGIAKISDSATVIDFKRKGFGVWILLRKDGTALYSAKDLALAEKKFSDFKLDKSLVITEKAQDLHFKQLIQTLKIAKFKFANKYLHISYNAVRFPWGKMSSRTGENILYTELKNDLLKRAIKETNKRNPSWTSAKIKQVSLLIALSALKYSMISQDSNKVLIFDPNKEISFEGDTGPYLQYTYARASSILSKVKPSATKIDFSLLIEPSEIQLIKKLELFPLIVEKASLAYKPYLIANYLFSLCQHFNEFYHKNPVIKTSTELRNARLLLVKALKQTLGNALNLLGINPLTKM